MKRLEIDTRKAQDIERRIADLADQYDTGWTPDFEKPDIGTTIARLYARNVEENIGLINEVLSRYHTEFVNMLDISLLPAKPASSIVVMNMIADTVPGFAVPKGTKLLTEGDEPTVFETDHSLYVTGSRITSSFMTDGESGGIVPLLGSFTRPPLPGQEPELIEKEAFEPFALFGKNTGIEQDAVAFYHPSVFDAAREDVFVRIEGNQRIIDGINSGRYEFVYPTEEGALKGFKSVKQGNATDTFILNKDDDSSIDTILIRANSPQDATREVKRISFSSRGREIYADAVNSGSNDFDVKRFLPFTDTLSVYDECYIGCDKYFAKAGAKITVEFDLTFEEHRITLSQEEEDNDLRIIKRRKMTARQEVYANCSAQEVSIEYFNGTGWRKLPLESDTRDLFARDRGKRVKLSFICPGDWEGITSGSYAGRAIRFQLLKSDNCYIRPAIHHYPVIRELKIAYSYEEKYVDAQRATLWYGTKTMDITDFIKSGKNYPVFQKKTYEEDALYIGLSKEIENGPASILFKLEDGRRFSGLKTVFEYYGYDGWRPMKVLDYTRNFTRSGAVMFMPPSDMKKTGFEGNDGYFIRVIRLRKESPNEDRTVLPKICDIVMNAVSVSNIETRPQVPVYIDEITPGIRFALGAENVLDAEVWVNEFGKYSRDTMLRMAADTPELVEITYDAQNQITSFFVKWKETDRLETSADPRVYVLDRLANELIFGDGVHTYIPRVVDDIALKFSVRCCNGQRGNVDIGEITEPESMLEYVGEVRNPVKAYGGSNIETLENALERGAAILSSRNRLVSIDDYKRAIMSYSDSIDQVAGIVGMTAEGEEDPSMLTFILLMKDFSEGSFAFHRITGGLKEELLKHCELTVTIDKLRLMEPVFVDISVSVWVEVVEVDDSFEIQSLLRQCLEDYLNPTGYGTGRGWKIGSMPKKPQILMRLDVLKSRAIVKKSVMTAHYSDHSGEHEVDLTLLKTTPFMVPRNGKHEVHIIY
ncbi:MAG: hypothetical protein IJ796_07830 [Lachnospiraceae bacterium]|nr:hypothetical protein [Lachnospiraceae bacterium]